MYEAEANLDKNTIAREQLCQQMVSLPCMLDQCQNAFVLRIMQLQGIEQLSEEPVLLTVLHRYLFSGDATASPRIAAKAKSSIAAKPGGELLD